MILALQRFLICAGMILAVGVNAAEPATYGAGDFSRIEKIDTHVHLHGKLPVFMARARWDGFRLLTINVNYSVFPPLDRQLSDALALKKAYPDRVAFATTFDASDSNSKGWLARTQRHLIATVKQGAVGVKVWKDIGMQQRDPDGRAVMIDDPLFTPIFDALEERGIVVLGHIGEPRNAWLPLDAMTTSGDREYFTQHPQYHMFAHPEWPSYEEQIAARDRLLDRHRHLEFVGLHLASLEWSTDRIAEFLRRYPLATVDLAARLVHLKLQASVDPAKVRQFFIEHQDRILYATDLTRLLDQEDAAFAEEAHRVWTDDWSFLAGTQTLRSDEFAASFQGLALPREVIDKIYSGNARRIFPTAWR
ncbi:MAG: amidohydrolase family protein [Steroidobacteraceae bacterium]